MHEPPPSWDSWLLLICDQLWVRLFWKSTISHVWPDGSLAVRTINRPSGKLWLISYIIDRINSLICRFNYLDAVDASTSNAAGKLEHLALSLPAPLGLQLFQAKKVIDTSLLRHKGHRHGRRLHLSLLMWLQQEVYSCLHGRNSSELVSGLYLLLSLVESLTILWLRSRSDWGFSFNASPEAGARSRILWLYRTRWQGRREWDQAWQDRI